MEVLPCHLAPNSFDRHRCLRELEDIEADLRQLVSGLTEGQFQATPPSGAGWPISFCIEHLALTGSSLVSNWDSAINTAKATGCEPVSAAYSWWERRILNFFEPPYRLKTRTTRPFQPRNHRTMNEVVRRFLAMHREFSLRLEASKRVDPRCVKVQSPFASRVQYALGFSSDLALAHERRHIWQAWQIRRAIEEPA